MYGHTCAVLNVTFSPDGAMIATVSRDNRLIIWDLHSGKESHFKSIVLT